MRKTPVFENDSQFRFRRLDLPALAFAAAVLTVAGLAATAAHLLVLPQNRGTAAHVDFAIGGRHVVVPARWVSEHGRPAEGGGRASLRIPPSLRIPLGELLGEPEAEDTGEHTGMSDPVRISLTFAPSDLSLPPGERPALLYSRFLSAEAVPSEGGLIRRAFRVGTPYEDEALYLTSPDGTAFFARCIKGQRPPAPDACLTEIRIEGLDVQIRLPLAALPRWKAIMGAVKNLVVHGT